ncbi:MAG: hypothetical protein LBE12_08555 [Planctomycetaceae bacterium]|jgi:hypothetical protein|nr:hypothetical protein [Planctomycetaceae bacterium]
MRDDFLIDRMVYGVALAIITPFLLLFTLKKKLPVNLGKIRNWGGGGAIRLYPC